MRMTLALIPILALIGCGNPNDPDASAAAVQPLYAIAAESLTSMVANELGTLSGPPTPGALGQRACASTRCTGSGRSVVVEKRLEGCGTLKAGMFTGNVFISVFGVPEAAGCSTPHGPPEFRRWPPSTGSVSVEFGEPWRAGAAIATNPRATYEHVEAGGRRLSQWGRITLHFDGTLDTPLEVDQWARVAGGGDEGRFHFTSKPHFRIRTERFSDISPRSFHGVYAMTDETRGIRATVTLDNVTYRKRACCHPLSGSLSVAPEAGNAGSPFRVEFSDEFCGKATLIDPLGRALALELPGCSS